MRVLIYLALLLSLLLPGRVEAEDIPPHLAGFAGQLIKAKKGELKAPEGEEAALIATAYDKLKERSLHRFAGRPLKLDADPAAIAEALGLDDEKGTQAVAGLLPALIFGTGDDDGLLAELYTAAGRTPPTGEDLSGTKKRLAETRNATLANLPTAHTIELEDGEEIEFDWDPKEERFSIAINNPVEGDKAYRTEISGKTKTAIDDSGKVRTDVDPDETAIAAKDAEDLKKDVADILGKWRDGDGDIWMIRERGGRAGAITLARLRGGKEGDEEVFADAVFWGGRLTASRNHDDVRDMKSSLPDEIKAQLAGTYHPLTRILLKAETGEENGKTVFKGSRESRKVTYSPDNYEIDSIHSPYLIPLALSRDEDTKRYRIAGLNFDELTWHTTRTELLELIRKYTDERDYALTQAGQEARERDTLIDRLDWLLEEEVNAYRRRKNAQDSLKALDAPKGTEAEQAQLKKLQANLENEEINLAALEGLNESSPDKEYQDEIDRLKPAIAFLKSQIEKVEKQIARARPANAGQVRGQIIARYLKAHDDTIRLPLEIARTEFAIELAVERTEELDRQVKELNATLAPLLKARDRFEGEKDRIENQGGLIETVVATADGEEVFSANREILPYKLVLQELDDSIAETVEKRNRAGRVFRRAQEDFVRESELARDYLSAVESSIMTSAIGQSMVETGFFAREVFENFSKGGPLYALGAAVYKRVEWAATGSEAAKLVDENAIRKQVELEIRNSVNDETAQEASYWGPPWSQVEEVYEKHKGRLKTYGKRFGKTVAKHSGAREAVEIVSLKLLAGEWAQKAHVKQLQKGLDAYIASNSVPTSNWLKGLDEKAGALLKANTDLDALHTRMKQGVFGKLKGNASTSLEAFREQGIVNLAKSAKFKDFAKEFGADFGKGILKDEAKSMAKKFFQEIEAKAWHDFFHQDHIARQRFGFMKTARRYYWDLGDKLEALREARRKFVETHDAVSGFKIFKDETFSGSARLEVTLYAADVEKGGIDIMAAGRAKVEIAEIAGEPSGKVHVFDARKFDGKDEALPLSVSLTGK